MGRIAGPRDLDRRTTHRSFDGVIRPLRDRDACRAHHRNGVRPRDTQHRGFVRTIGGPREPRRDRALQDQHRALTTLCRHGEADPRPGARRPAIDHDHSFGSEQRAVDECAIARVLDIAGEQALQAGDRALSRSRQLNRADLGRRHDSTGAQLIDDFRGHRVPLEPRHRGARRAGKDIAHRPASSPALCPAKELHSSAAPRPSSVRDG